MKFSFHFTKAFLVLLWNAFPLWGALTILITLCGCLLAVIEHLSIGAGIYFAWITSTTVGYGDLSPTTDASRLLAILIAFLGMPLNGLIVALSVLAAKLAIDKHSRLSQLINVAGAVPFLDLDSNSGDDPPETSG